MPHEQRNVFRAFAQRRDLDRKHIQPVVQVAAELLLGHHSFKVAMSRSHKPDVDCLRPRTPQAFEFPLLQNSQEFWLEFQRDIADLVQKQRALVRQLQAASRLRDRTREGAPLMPEEFTLQQTPGNGSAVELNQSPLPPAAALVNGARNELFSCACLSQ